MQQCTNETIVMFAGWRYLLVLFDLTHCEFLQSVKGFPGLFVGFWFYDTRKLQILLGVSLCGASMDRTLCLPFCSLVLASMTYIHVTV
jgi:hypothetical protein